MKIPFQQLWCASKGFALSRRIISSFAWHRYAAVIARHLAGLMLTLEQGGQVKLPGEHNALHGGTLKGKGFNTSLKRIRYTRTFWICNSRLI